MRPLSARELLDIWETSARQPIEQRALRLLGAAQPEASYEDLAQLPVGRRDEQLMSLRERLFGAQLIGVVSCPLCGEHLQLTVNAADLHVAHAAESDRLSLTVDGYAINYRLPNSADLLMLANCDSVDAGRTLLLKRCLQNARYDNVDQQIDALPTNVLDVVSAHMAQADPQADLQFYLVCPACRHHWLAAFDVMAFLWNEIDHWAHRILRDVHVLALNYGWSEADILTMNVARRQAYLELIDSE